MSRRGAAAKYYAQRLTWLLAHADLTDGVPGLAEDVTEANRPALERLRKAMAEAGLFGAVQNAMQRDRETVRRLVSEVRGVYREVPWW